MDKLDRRQIDQALRIADGARSELLRAANTRMATRSRRKSSPGDIASSAIAAFAERLHQGNPAATRAALEGRASVTRYVVGVAKLLTAHENRRATLDGRARRRMRMRMGPEFGKDTRSAMFAALENACADDLDRVVLRGMVEGVSASAIAEREPGLSDWQAQDRRRRLVRLARQKIQSGGL